MDLVVDIDQMEVRYVVDVPNAIVRTAIRPNDNEPIEAMLGELTTGLVVDVDGVSVVPKTLSARRLQGDKDTQLLELVLTTPIGAPAKRVRVSNGNLPEIPAYFVNTVLVGPGVAVLDSSLMQMANGEVQRDHNGRWRIGNTNRTVEIDLAFGDGWLAKTHQWLLQATYTKRPAAEAAPKTSRQMLFSPVSTPGTTIVGLILVGLVSIPLGATSKGAKSLFWVIPMGLVLLLSWLAPDSWWSHTEFVAGLAAAVFALGLLSRQQGHWLWGLGLWACLFSTHHWAVSALTVAVAGVGGLTGYLAQHRLRSASLSRSFALVLLVAGVLLLCRGAGGLFWG
jgi:hypothetical protein